MGCQAMRFPDPMYGRSTDADGIGHHPHRPVGRFTGRLGHGEVEHALYGIRGHRQFAGRSGFVAQEPIHALVHEAFLPAPDIGLRQPRASNNLVGPDAVGRRQDHLGAGDVLLSAIAISDDPLEATKIIRRNGDADPCSHPARIEQIASNGNPLIETIH